MAYNWKSETSNILRILRASRAVKIKAGWSRWIGAGFICDDISRIVLTGKRRFTIDFNWPYKQSFKAHELNLRETEEAIKFLERQTG